MASVNDEIVERLIRHLVLFQRVENGEVRVVLDEVQARVLGPLEARIASRLARIRSRGPDVTFQITKALREVAQEVKRVAAGGFKQVGAEFRLRLEEVGISESEWMVNTFRQTWPLAQAIREPPIEILRAIPRRNAADGQVLRDALKELEGATLRDTLRQVQIGLTRGEGVPQMVNRLIGTGKPRRGGVWQTTKARAETVVRTTMTHVSSTAYSITSQANADIIAGEVFIATLDSRTTPQCAALDGRFFQLGDGPFPPIHRRCRSRRRPQTKSWKELGLNFKDPPPLSRASRQYTSLREALSTQVSADVHFEQWLKNQPKEIADKVLGKGAAEIWRKGRIPLGRFVTKELRPLTLKELRAIEDSLPSPAAVARNQRFPGEKPQPKK